MNLSEALALIQHAGWNSNVPARWADLGCGEGLFTEALARMLPPRSVVHAVDTDAEALFRVPEVPHRHLSRVCADFNAFPWMFAPDMDGLLMANSLHYVADKRGFLEEATSYLGPAGRFLLIEYDTRAANPWVPYPLPFDDLMPLMADLGFGNVRKLGEHPSRFRNGNLYAAVAER